MTIQMNAIDLSGTSIMLQKVFISYQFVDEILKCDHSNECY